MNNFSTHKHVEMRDWVAANMSSVFTIPQRLVVELSVEVCSGVIDRQAISYVNDRNQ
ncbi:hypothetical protein HMPREF9565_01624 [Cutibacterium acnes HL053PA2]|jgi:hypothetical protein|nr:hypothetical protein HMPREF9575_01846 [Cutibacterium acnes HL110PA1]EFS76079.1 hypothetical protein HMPREF9591_02117 [Cutibacterium acnes HL086PA1]EFT06619.1 hypothetical protein HMPREF9618_01841 [Cutibacterium acnes HL082PA1]EFT49786.1 hypothetical protein HMPREF9565_01624 [Cutibacterium acnes HL053PA2]EFT54197.1 hypothetical protein HMPREF9569_00247 [Cutibacterium acnes HL078PA1]EGF00070.1 hypothetical protein HMPREF9584_01847 [Cutibacterium acnes HL092PA1]